MADFGFYHRVNNDSEAVEDLLSQAKDLYVLEQIASINLSSFTDTSSNLPNDLETRFRRLKSLPVSRPHPVSSFVKSNLKDGFGDFSNSSRFSRDCKSFSARTHDLKLRPKERLRACSSSSFTSIDLASPLTDLNRLNRKSKSKLSWFGKLLPPQGIGCLWSTPTKSSTKKSSKSKVLSLEEELKKTMEETEESQRLQREAEKLNKRVRKLSSSSSRF